MEPSTSSPATALQKVGSSLKASSVVLLLYASVSVVFGCTDAGGSIYQELLLSLATIAFHHETDSRTSDRFVFSASKAWLADGSSHIAASRFMQSCIELPALFTRPRQ